MSNDDAKYPPAPDQRADKKNFLAVMFVPTRNRSFGLILLLAGLCTQAPLGQFAFAQSLTDSSAAADSALAAWSEASDYEILRLRLLRWLQKYQDSSPSTITAPMADLLREAEIFAAHQDFITAKLLLEAAWDLTRTEASAVSSRDSSGQQLLSPRPEQLASAAQPRWLWQPEALLGMDFWRQEFEIGYAQEESLFVQDAGNPYTGFRLGLQRNSGALSNLQGYALLKTSRDYNSGEAELRVRQAFGAAVFGRLESRFETTRYLRDFDLRYWQNTGKALLAATLSPRFRLEADDEFRLRRYASQNELSRNYWQNEAGLAGVYTAGFSTRLRARYSFLARAHAQFAGFDYFEHRIDASLFKSTASQSSFYLQNLWRRRVYPRGLSDSTFENTHAEEYLRADLRLGIGDFSALRLEGQFTLRKYPPEIDSRYTPNFLETSANPQFQFKLLKDWQASLGYLFALRQHDADSVAASFLGYEDYYSHGFTLGLDFLSTKGLLLSVSNAFEVRTYPNVSSNNLIISNSYSDRYINSLLLFISWTLTPNWQVGAFANFDNEISRVREANDSRNTLFSVDLTYIF